MVCLRPNLQKDQKVALNYTISSYKVDQLALPQIICCVLHRWLYFSLKSNKKLVTTRLCLKYSLLKMLFKTEKENWNLNYLERLSF